MDIYKSELAIAELIIKNNSIAYNVEVEPAEISDFPKIALSSIHTDTPNTPDLFYTKSILVSTNMNKNTDYFDPVETWAARKTPVDKPMNIEHDHKRVVGHITSAWAIDEDHKILADDIELDKLPAFFHLCNGSVIYTRWQDEDLQAQADKLIEEIKDGLYCVSMEAFFNNFDYILANDEENIIIARDDSTSFLTKKLRCYGGDGTHEGYRVGRVLRNLTFSACGYVKRPANPDSIIFANSTEKNIKNIKIAENNGVYIKCTSVFNQENEMSENILEKQIAELKDQVKALQADNKSLNEKLASANTEKLEQEIASLKEQLVEAQKMMDDEKKKKKMAEDASCALTDELNQIKADYEKAQAALEAIKTEAVKANRVRKLEDAGLSNEDAVAKAETLIALSDEQFEAVANALSLVKPAPKASEQVEDEKAAEADAELAEAEEEDTEEVDASVADQEDDTEELMAAVAAHYDNKFETKENK